MRIAVFGAGGKVGAVVMQALLDAGHDVSVADPTGCDAAVDFTAPDVVVANITACLDQQVPVVIGTTGWRLDEVDRRAQRSGVPVFFAPNFALGAVLMMRFAAAASRWFADARIVELHSATKRDAPSATAIATRDAMAFAPAIASVRLRGLVAHQRVVFGGPGERLTIRHDTTSREAFVPGVLLALDRIRSLPPGLTVGLDALLS